uniref:Uncharacterized protein n=1 Tax=Mola mola TaxID=94237 RepID=A0A3Q3WPB0_MOLML
MDGRAADLVCGRLLSTSSCSVSECKAESLAPGAPPPEGAEAARQLLDVCGTCHINATCEDKADGTGKVCNCKYGFVGNGRTYCQDKDECQIGAQKICGQHTTCHNTHGSYYCTCLSGYSPSNSMAVFIPNDGTHCQDIDECRVAGLCGDGAQCRNLEGSYECSCLPGYRVHGGTEPFQPHRENASCRGVDCGAPPALPHTHMLWNESSRMGAEVLYRCMSGYHNVGKGNVSVCTAAGQWENPSMLCQETLCGNPPVLELTERVWNSDSTPGSTVHYYCKEGFYHTGGLNVSVCNKDGQWSLPTLSCQGNDTREVVLCVPVVFLCCHFTCVTVGSSMQKRHLYVNFTNLIKLKGFPRRLCKISRLHVFLMYLTEKKPPITELLVLHEKCVHWNAEKYEEDTQSYKVRRGIILLHLKLRLLTIFASRDAEQVGLCLNLLPVTNYSISITALSARFTATISTCTSLPGVTAQPTPTFIPCSCVTVKPCCCHFSGNSPGHITALIDVRHVGAELNFTVGDGLFYGGFFNAPLKNGRNYYIILRAVSQWKTVGFMITY